MFTDKDLLAVNSLRALSIAQIEAANSGHPGLPLGAAPMAYALFADHLEVNPQDARWFNRDRFVLSAGHGSALLYSLLHLSEFNLSLEDLKGFRQWQSKTPGHPEYNHTEGVEATTGPLGQGLAQAVGMAMAEQHTAALYNTDDFEMIDHFTYCLVGDGDLMEGISYEAISYAGRQKLDKLIVLYDSNDISLDGDLSQAFNENIAERFEAAHWHYIRVDDGNDLNEISAAITRAKEFKGKPTIIEVKTVIGYGSPEQGTSKVHGSPLGQDNWAATKDVYQWTLDHFEVPEEAREIFHQKVVERGQKAYQAWQDKFKAYQQAYPEKAEMMRLAFERKLPEDFDQALEYLPDSTKTDASRSSSGKAIQALAQKIPYFWGGSADLSGSNKTMINDSMDFMPNQREGKNIWFGVREFAMAAMLNGITLHGGSRVFGGTFFVFSDYLRPAVRLSALSQLPVVYVMTHDSVAVGEDGPTHEPIEQLAGFRAMPNLNVIRPADVNETFAAWKVAIQETDRPSLLVLSRQNLPVLTGSRSLAEAGVDKGAYVLSPSQADQADGIIIATGSEVQLALEVQKILKDQEIDVSVVSMPASNRFDEQSQEYQESVLPDGVENRMSIEMGASLGWHKYVGRHGLVMGIDRFGASAPGETVVKEYGFDAEQLAQAYLNHFKK
ncbi:transketolase [Ignavigranum ruoffiae]